jgi:UDP-2-acetamido-3-amino-2,3-dideoxy-glucuronate N-acetyltransferase
MTRRKRPPRSEPRIIKTKVRGVAVHHFGVVNDPRGNLIASEFTKHIPFLPHRFFMVFDVPHSEMRGEHAHKKCHQFLICLKGSCTVTVDDGRRRQSIRLDDFHRGVHLAPKVWCTHEHYTRDAVLLVFASHFYDPADYIRDYASFRTLVNRRYL